MNAVKLPFISCFDNGFDRPRVAFHAFFKVFEHFGFRRKMADLKGQVVKLLFQLVRLFVFYIVFQAQPVNHIRQRGDCFCYYGKTFFRRFLFSFKRFEFRFSLRQGGRQKTVPGADFVHRGFCRRFRNTVLRKFFCIFADRRIKRGGFFVDVRA